MSRRRYQFSLRTLLIGVAMLAVPMPWAAKKLHEWQDAEAVPQGFGMPPLIILGGPNGPHLSGEPLPPMTSAQWRRLYQGDPLDDVLAGR